MITLANVERKGKGWAGAVTHCRKGHELSEANVGLWNGYRQCRTCANQRKREQYERNKQRRNAWAGW